MDYLIGKIGGKWGVIGEHCYDSSVKIGGTIDSTIFDKYNKVPNSYSITNGQFVQLMDMEAVDNAIAKAKSLEYPSLVDSKIRERYSISNELAILRQRDNKSEEFEEYNSYCEQCKIQAKQELNI